MHASSGRFSASLAGRIPPAGADKTAALVLASRGMRGFCDGFIAVLLPAYLLALGFSQLDVGLVSTVTLLGSALATIAVGMLAGRVAHRRMLMLAATLMAATGIGFASLSTLWALIAVAFVGTLNPSAGDVSLFLPLEQSRLAEAAAGDARTALFARYSLIGALSAAAGSLAAGLPLWLAAHTSIPLPGAMRGMFVVYAGAGVAVWLLYRHLPLPEAHAPAAPPPLGPSRRIVTRLAMLLWALRKVVFGPLEESRTWTSFLRRLHVTRLRKDVLGHESSQKKRLWGCRRLDRASSRKKLDSRSCRFSAGHGAAKVARYCINVPSRSTICNSELRPATPTHSGAKEFPDFRRDSSYGLSRGLRHARFTLPYLANSACPSTP